MRNRKNQPAQKFGNDYAEYRTTVIDVEPGRVVIENNDDTLSISTERLMP